jgi:hypothetical protein
MANCGIFEVEWQVFAEPMNIVHHERLVGTSQMVHVVNLQENAFDRSRQFEELFDVLS